MELNFFKYEGAGNDFILLDGRGSQMQLPGGTIRLLCDRHIGIGADGLMVLTDEPGYDFRMRYYNSDGGEVNMCGNGGRCIVLFADHLGIGGPEKFFVGQDGEHHARMISMGEQSAFVELEMIDVDSFEYAGKTFFLNTGVPHYVEFVDDVSKADVEGRGKLIRNSERFHSCGGTNVNFVEVAGPGYIRVRTYERGVEGETLACGTGATAAAIATYLFAQNDTTDFTVNVPGGELEVKFSVRDNQFFSNIRLTGPARRVFSGVVTVPNAL